MPFHRQTNEAELAAMVGLDHDGETRRVDADCVGLLLAGAPGDEATMYWRTTARDREGRPVFGASELDNDYTLDPRVEGK